MDAKLLLRDNRIKRVEMSGCTKRCGFRLVIKGHNIPPEIANELSVLLAKLMTNDLLSTESELKKFKKKLLKEGFLAVEKTFLDYEKKSNLDREEPSDREVISITTYLRIYRTPKKCFKRC